MKRTDRLKGERWAIRSLVALGACLAGGPVPRAAAAAPAAREIAVECEDFEFPGDWAPTDPPQASGGRALISGSRVELPAVTAVEIPAAGEYHLWVRAMDFPEDRPGTRRFRVAVGGRESPEMLGDSGQAGFAWERGGRFALAKGPVLVALRALTAFARADAVLLTTDADFVPSRPLGDGGRHRRSAPRKVAGLATSDPLAAEAATIVPGRAPLATLGNEHLRLAFVSAVRGGVATVVPRVEVRDGAWREIPVDAGSEIYAVVDAGEDARFDYTGFYPHWQSGRRRTDFVTVELGGASVRTSTGLPGAIWAVGELHRFVPRSAAGDGRTVRLEFHPGAAGQLTAEWELRPGERAARVRLVFAPAHAGQYALGYHLFFRRPLAAVDEILLPMMWHRHRLPERPRTLLDPMTPTPVALAATHDAAGTVAWAVTGEPDGMPFAWPDPHRPRFGLAIRDHAGAVQPGIYGPVPGTTEARARPGATVTLGLRVLVRPGDWYAGFRTAADEIHGLRDYRANLGTSLTEAALNMSELLQHDERGGWWERGKGFYQIETKNGVTHAAPLLLLSLYRMSGDEDLYRRRALPAMEYVLSRRSAHFSPVPQDTGRYDPGGMDGPVKLFGTTMYAGFQALANGRTPAFAEIALPQDGIRPTGGYSHGQPFDDWLARYEATGEPAALAHARRLADAYVAEQVQRPPARELGAQPFFFISFVPDWEGLLRLFEATGERRYLDAAAFGARQLMTGLWTQPVIPAGKVRIHPGGQYKGDTLKGWRGPVEYRLGLPRRAHDTPEREVPAWVVSNVGLGFEQPSTFRGSGQGRQIYQMGWAADFLRLARHTGDAAFEMCARNATLGRWANYPGYYATGFTDLPLRPRYPYEGPDVTDFYYHHLPPHLAWTIDYLVAAAELRSGGRITFPSQRQNGYAYFDSRVYGHAPGRILGHDGTWLWWRRGLVAISQPQFNYLTARRGRELFVILMNESARAERGTVTFAPAALGFESGPPPQLSVLAPDGGEAPGELRRHETVVELPPRGWTVLRVRGVGVDVPTHRLQPPAGAGRHPGTAVATADRAGVEARGAALQVAPGSWDAYLWCTARPDQAASVTFHVALDGAWREQRDDEYPFEVSVPVPRAETPVQFYLTGTTPAGEAFRTGTAVIGAPADDVRP